MNCSICDCSYKDNKDKKHHMMSITHQTNEYNQALEARINKDDSAYLEREGIISDYKCLEEDTQFECAKCNKVTTSIKDMIQHERHCMNVELTHIIKPENFLSCDDCGYKIYERGQKFKPAYMMNRHKTVCKDRKTKKQIKAIKDSLNTLDKSVVDEIFKLISN